MGEVGEKVPTRRRNRVVEFYFNLNVSKTLIMKNKRDMIFIVFSFCCTDKVTSPLFLLAGNKEQSCNQCT